MSCYRVMVRKPIFFNIYFIYKCGKKNYIFLPLILKESSNRDDFSLNVLWLYKWETYKIWYNLDNLKFWPYTLFSDKNNDLC